MNHWFFSKKFSIYAAVILGLLDLLYTLANFGGIDALSAVSAAMVVLFVWLTGRKNEDMLFRLRSSVLSLFFAFWLFFFFFALDEPMFTFMIKKYAPGMMAAFYDKGYSQSGAFRLLDVFSRDMGFYLLLHSGIAAYAVLEMSKGWSLFFRVPFFYILVVLAAFLEPRLMM